MWENKTKRAESLKKMAEEIKVARKSISFGDYFGLARRFWRAYRKREYRAVPWKSLLMGVATIAYLIMPVDFIPDFFFLIGWADDVTLFSLFLASMKKDLDKFADWEAVRHSTIEEKSAPVDSDTV